MKSPQYNRPHRHGGLQVWDKSSALFITTQVATFWRATPYWVLEWKCLFVWLVFLKENTHGHPAL